MFIHGLLIYFVLFLAAILYFILDPKIRFSFIPGIIIGEIAGTSFLWCIVFGMMKPGALINWINSLGIIKVHKLNLIAFSAVVAAVILVVLYFLGKLIGKCIFNGKKDQAVLAKILYIAASVLTMLTGIFQALNSFTLTEVPYTTYQKFSSFFNVIHWIRIRFGYLLVNVKHALPCGIILAVTGLICLILICTKIPMFKKKKKEKSNPVT
jgi:hypothetical protein